MKKAPVFTGAFLLAGDADFNGIGSERFLGLFGHHRLNEAVGLNAGEDIFPVLFRNKTKNFCLFIGDSNLLLIFSHVRAKEKLLTLLQSRRAVWKEGGELFKRKAHAVDSFWLGIGFFSAHYNQQQCDDQKDGDGNPFRCLHLRRGKIVADQNREHTGKNQKQRKNKAAYNLPP